MTLSKGTESPKSNDERNIKKRMITIHVFFLDRGGILVLGPCQVEIVSDIRA